MSERTMYRERNIVITSIPDCPLLPGDDAGTPSLPCRSILYSLFQAQVIRNFRMAVGVTSFSTSVARFPLANGKWRREPAV